MESNRDEAERCIGIALAAVKANQPERARRFLEKAQRLYPSPRVRGERRRARGGARGGRGGRGRRRGPSAATAASAGRACTVRGGARGVLGRRVLRGRNGGERDGGKGGSLPMGVLHAGSGSADARGPVCRAAEK